MTEEAPADDLHLAEAGDLLLFVELLVGGRNRCHSGFVGWFQLKGHDSETSDASDEAPAEERLPTACVAGERNDVMTWHLRRRHGSGDRARHTTGRR